MKREPIFAFQGWYPSSKEQVTRSLERYIESDRLPKDALAVIVPHAGWVFSGATAGKLYGEVEVPPRVVVLCPTHHAGGGKAGIWAEGHWTTPLGDMPVDSAFCKSLLEKSEFLQEDYEGHSLEHAIEIQLPFIQFRNPNAELVPIRLGHLSLEEAREFSKTLAEAIRTDSRKTLIVASTDMSHESDPERVRTNDTLAREQVLGMNAEGLYQAVQQHSITMCGYIPTAVAIETAKLLGASRAEQVGYTTSAEVSGRTDYVVGYLAARFVR